MGISELRQDKLKKLENIKKIQPPYPIFCKRTHTINEVLKSFSILEKEKKEVILVGRIMRERIHGGSTFLDIQDGTGKIQALLRRDVLGEKSYKIFLDNFEIGDIVELRGTLFVTKTKEKTIEVLGYKILAKALRPLPDKWHGLKEV
ncbi:lysine--tRNA ligase, partial [Candidatus Parcubacteria bacterium]|nr:lysine--tRNA ligase [Candidatus Parcubacteria bacterium]